MTRRHPLVAGGATGALLLLALYLIDYQLYRMLLHVPGLPLPLWLEVGIHLAISVSLAWLYAWVTRRLRWHGWAPGLLCGALASLVWFPLAGWTPMPLVWLFAHLGWGALLGRWSQ